MRAILRFFGIYTKPTMAEMEALELIWDSTEAAIQQDHRNMIAAARKGA